MDDRGQTDESRLSVFNPVIPGGPREYDKNAFQSGQIWAVSSEYRNGIGMRILYKLQTNC